MTCIIGMAKDGQVYMGGDSSVSSNGNYRLTAKKKVFRNGQYLIGYTSSTRMGDILRTMELPRIQSPDTAKRMILKFIPAVREALKDGGVVKVNNSVESCGSFLVATHGHLFEVDIDFQIEEYIDNYAAVGSGWISAISAMMALDKFTLTPEEIILQSLAVAGKTNCYTRSPYYCLSLENECL